MFGDLGRRPRGRMRSPARAPLEQRALGEVAHAVPQPGVQLRARFELDPRAPQAGRVHRRAAHPRLDALDDAARGPAVRVERRRRDR